MVIYTAVDVDEKKHRAELADRNARDLVPVAPGTIVVGFDGSRSSITALHTALALADRFAAHVSIVRAWNVDDSFSELQDDAGHVSSFDEITLAVRARLEQATRREVLSFANVFTEYRAVLDQPGEILTALSADALMLVVGTRGHGGIARLLLGSVSTYCVHHASCPVLVVPPSASS